MAAAPQFISAPNVGLTKFANADGTVAKTIFTAGASGSRIMALFATSSDLSSRQFALTLTRAGVSYQLDTPTIAGASAITPVVNMNMLGADWFQWLDPNEPHLILPTGITITAAAVVAVTSGKEVSFFVMGGDF
jgi:short subunit dehydrogenase-like uncharacterized protein